MNVFISVDCQIIMLQVLLARLLAIMNDIKVYIIHLIIVYSLIFQQIILVTNMYQLLLNEFNKKKIIVTNFNFDLFFIKKKYLNELYSQKKTNKQTDIYLLINLFFSFDSFCHVQYHNVFFSRRVLNQKTNTCNITNYTINIFILIVDTNDVAIV